MAIAEFQEPPAGELGVVVRDDAVRNPEAMDDVGEEQHGDGTGLDRLGKFFDDDEQVGEAPSCSL
jgi:hypothetical protein